MSSPFSVWTRLCVIWKEGAALISACSKMLDEAEQKVVKLKKGMDGSPVELPFEDVE